MFKTKKEQAVADGGAAASSGIQYTSGDVARIAGVSLRQLQWWDERNVVTPVQEGHRRVYRQQDVIEVSVIAELRRKGFSLQKIRRVLKFLQKEMGRRLADAVAENGDIHLITDGKNIYLEDQPVCFFVVLLFVLLFLFVFFFFLFLLFFCCVLFF